jgi:hypothetical protein
MPYNEGYQQGLASPGWTCHTQDPIYCAGFDAGVIMADQEQIAATASSSSTNSQGGNPQQQSPLQLHAGLLPGQAGGPGSSASALGSAIIVSGLKYVFHPSSTSRLEMHLRTLSYHFFVVLMI